MAGWDDTPPTKTDKDAQASHFAFNQFSAAFATDAPISASKFGKEKQSFDDWSAPPVYALQSSKLRFSRPNLDAEIGASVANAALNWLNAKCDAWASLSVFVGGVSSQPAMAALAASV